MSEFRLKIKDNLLHVLKGIQQSLSLDVRNSSQLPLLDFVGLDPLPEDEKKKYGFSQKEEQNKGVIRMQQD